MKKLLSLCLFLVCALVQAQTTSVTATVSDSTSQAWINGTWTLTFVPNPANPNINIYNINGTPLSSSVINQKGTMNSLGALSFTTYKSNSISPYGSSWNIKVCPLANSLCGSYNFSTGSNSSMDLSSALTPIIPVPNFPAVAGSFGYNNTEARVTLPMGATYWNVINNCQEYYSGGSWQCYPGGSYLPSSGGVLTGGVDMITSSIPVIHDDDCYGDPDCNFTQAMFNHLEDTGTIKVLAEGASSYNLQAAPTLNIYNTYYSHTHPICAWQGPDTPISSATSSWTPQMVSEFRPGDTKANYTSCTTTYRQALANAANGSVLIITSGFATNIVALMQSPADSISPLTGAQLIKQKVKALISMGGYYPSSGSPESNFNHDPVNYNYLFTNWTSQNSYPPIYSIGTQLPCMVSGTPNQGPGGNAIPSFPSSNPSQYSISITGDAGRCVYDQLVLLYAIDGLSNDYASLWGLSANGTNTVSSSDGSNSWSSGTASGQYYINELNSFAAAYQAQISGLSDTNAPNGFWGAMSFLPKSIQPFFSVQNADGTTTTYTGDRGAVVSSLNDNYNLAQLTGAGFIGGVRGPQFAVPLLGGGAALNMSLGPNGMGCLNWYSSNGSSVGGIGCNDTPGSTILSFSNNVTNPTGNITTFYFNIPKVLGTQYTVQTNGVGQGNAALDIVSGSATVPAFEKWWNPGGFGATATATQVGGVVQSSIPVTNGGVNYLSSPTVSITDSGGPGTGATATATVVAGVITAITRTAGGSGYVSPVVTITQSANSFACFGCQDTVVNGQVPQLTFSGVPLNLANGLQIEGSQTFTSVVGSTGTKLPAATGSFTNGNLRATDSNSNEVDAGGTFSVASCTISGTTCTATIAHTYTNPLCVVTSQNSGVMTDWSCSVSGTTATVTAAGSNSAKVGIIVSSAFN